MSKPDGISEVQGEQLEVRFGGGMELQGLHNTALSILYNQDRYSKELWQAARNYLQNLLIHATDELCKPVGGQND